MTHHTCHVTYVNRERVSKVLQVMTVDSQLAATAAIFKVLGDPTRLRLLFALLEEELCVCDLAEFIVASQSAVSHQLRLLRTARLVKFRREGKMIYYRLDDEHVRRLLKEGLVHAEED